MKIKFFIYSILLLALGCKQNITNPNSIDYSVTIKEGVFFYQNDSIDDHLDSFEITKTDYSGSSVDVAFNSEYVTSFDTSKVGPSTVTFDFDGFTVNKDISVNEVIYKYVENNTGITITDFFRINRDFVVPEEYNGMIVTELDFPSFYSNKVIRTLTLPNTITRLGPIAESSTLESLVIPDSVKSIDIGAFSGTILKDVTFGSGLSEIPMGAFDRSQLEDVVIPGNIKYIGVNAFNSNNLKSIQLLEGVEEIENGAFYNNNLESLILPGSLKRVGTDAFSKNNFATITIPDTGIVIEDYAFRITYNETAVNVPESLNNSEELKRIFGCEPLIINGVEREKVFTTEDITAFNSYKNRILESTTDRSSYHSFKINYYYMEFTLYVENFPKHIVTKDENDNYILTITDNNGSTETSNPDINVLLGIAE